MASWYLGQIRYQKEDEAGRLKTINEQYLVDAVSHTEAESTLYKRITTGASDFSVKRITPVKLSDLFSYEDGEEWFKSKIVYFSVDEKSGKEKKIVNQMIVNAEGIQQALDRINESMRNFLIPYEVEALTKTKILDVIPYLSEGEENLTIPENMKPLSEVMAERQADSPPQSDQ
ncbi:DUF4494 domain-containing protein [Dyadobacter sp. CY261]|uniref:DUF4494 domain-containing protein n=1 Tax=Dyadobacter sp. CY261 TaxID=2907203 RepID=UPI001F33FCB4|nr:DUF4494 domain-containing protein [Dyadobacter sp. CY261]MCF0070259.1 DUF4494 domain-containing protein [Dyadobacter sp. CY261]